MLAGTVVQLPLRLSDVVLATDGARGLVHDKGALADTRCWAIFAPADVGSGRCCSCQFPYREATPVGESRRYVVFVQ